MLAETGARRVGDLGCGAGALTRDLLADRGIDHVVATDVSARALQLAARHLNLERMPDKQRERLTIFQSSLTYRDDRLAGLDAAVLMEVIEHLDPDRLPALERVVFGEAAPATVVVTTPNAEYNAHFADPRRRRVPAPGPPLRVDQSRVPRLGRPGRRRPTATRSGSCRSAPRHPRDGPPTQLAVFARHGRKPWT